MSHAQLINGKYCVCLDKDIKLQMLTSYGEEVNTYPVQVHNRNDIAIGTANNKEEYIETWNGDAVNRQIGFLISAKWPFFFTLRKVSDTISLGFVIGNPIGIYAEEYGLEYE